MKKIFILLLLLIPELSRAMLAPGFSRSEYTEMLRIAARQIAADFGGSEQASPFRFHSVYQSPVVGLKNQWELWDDGAGTAVISIRGTIADYTSWLANFYAAMVPASGTLQLEKDYSFNYHLADNPKAAVHTGWLIATGMLVKDMIPKIDSAYRAGIKNFIITGHSQGGGIAYLLTSHLYDLRKKGALPGDIVFKTYCSAAPKPGNLFYAYEFESTTGDWAFNVVNASDWVPEMPVSVQTTTDCNTVNPFVNALPTIRKQKFLQRIFLRHAYRKLSRPSRKSQEAYVFYLGDKMYSFVKKTMPDFVKPAYVNSMNYVRTGKTIVLVPDDGYKEKFPDNTDRLFMHHLFAPYYYLISHYDR